MFGNNNYKNVIKYEKIYKAHGVIRHKTWRPKGCGNGRHALLCGFHESSRWGHLGATDKPCGVRTVANPKQLLNGT